VPDYETERFSSAVSGLETEPEGGRRCAACFRLRLGRTAALAAEGGFEFFCTTLTVSPHKDAGLINELGRELGEASHVRWLPSDFKKRDGYRQSVALSAKYGLYRQNFCGCGMKEA
jgi:predicted adenine nucleotide alpha hydrolase (AANH) superfamily ATPase